MPTWHSRGDVAADREEDEGHNEVAGRFGRAQSGCASTAQVGRTAQDAGAGAADCEGPGIDAVE